MKDTIQLASLYEFYEADAPFYHQMCDIIEQGDAISLRSLDFTCRKLATSEGLDFIKDGRVVDISAMYNNYLDTHGKKNLDAFKRSTRINVLLHDRALKTTIAQLVYFRMLERHGIIDFVRDHITHIERKMSDDLQDIRKKAKVRKMSSSSSGVAPRRQGKRRKRKHALHIHHHQVTLNFNHPG